MILQNPMPLPPTQPLTTRNMSRDGEPLAVPPRPYIRVAAVSLPSGRHGVRGSCVNNRKVAHEPHFDIVGFQIRDLHRRS